MEHDVNDINHGEYDKESLKEERKEKENLEQYPPEEYVSEVNRESKSVLLDDDEEGKGKKMSDEELEKFKRGELGAEHFRYNDDGSHEGESRKVNVDPKDVPE